MFSALASRELTTPPDWKHRFVGWIMRTSYRGQSPFQIGSIAGFEGCKQRHPGEIGVCRQKLNRQLVASQAVKSLSTGHTRGCYHLETGGPKVNLCKEKEELKKTITVENLLATLVMAIGPNHMKVNNLLDSGADNASLDVGVRVSTSREPDLFCEVVKLAEPKRFE